MEINIFTRNDLVLAAKSSRKCNPNHVWQVFIFLTILLGTKLLLLLVNSFVPINSYELCLLFRSDWVLRGKRLYLEQSGIVCKILQRVHPETFFSSFWQTKDFLRGKRLYLERSGIVCKILQRVHPETFFSSFWQTKDFYWPTLLSESTHMDCVPLQGWLSP